MSGFVDNWRNAWRIRAFRDQLLVSMAALLVVLILLRVFQHYIETRSGIVLPDRLLPLFSPTDFNWITYSLIYSGTLLGIVSLCSYPFSLLLVVRAFVVMILLRIACLFLLPLDPPTDFVPLVDPIIRLQVLSPVLTRDLFFSGHTAMMALFAFTARWKDMKIIFSCAAIVVSVFLLVQHAHYTIDVVAAPCFAYVALGIAKWITVQEFAGAPVNNL